MCVQLRPRASMTAVRPATPIAASVMPVRQGRPIESLTMTADVDAELRPQPLAQPGRRRVRVDRQQREFVAGHVRDVHPGGREDEPVPGLDDPQIAPSGNDPHRLGVDRPPAGGLLAQIGVGGRQRDQPALDLRYDLGGHHQYVAVLQRGAASATAATRSSPGRRSADSRDRQDLEPSGAVVGGREVRHQRAPGRRGPCRRSRRRRTSAAGRRGPPRPGTSAASVLCTSQPSRTPPDPRAP